MKTMNQRIIFIMSVLVVATLAVVGYIFIRHPWGPINMNPLPAVTTPSSPQNP